MDQKTTVIYNNINTLIFEHFKNNSLGSDTLIMAFDDNDLGRISGVLKISKEELIKVISKEGEDNWDIFLNEGELIPLCYGLIALQILCASRMEYGKYNELLADKLSITQSSLQNVFTDYQDRLWKTARKHIESTGYQVSFPSSSSGPHRYVKYPKSQAYLNQKDLEILSGLFFHRRLKPHINISLLDFVEILEINFFIDIPKQFITSHTKKVRSQIEFKQDVFQKQLYNYYVNWNGEMKLEGGTLGTVPLSKLFVDESKGFFTINNNQEYRIEFDSGFKETLLKFNIIKNSDRFILLKREPSWGDFEEVKKVQIGDEVIIVVLKPNLSVYNFLIETEVPKLSILNENIFVFQFDIENHHIEGLQNCISTNHFSIEWFGGIKIDRNTYLKGFGPLYRVVEKCTIVINGRFKKLLKDDVLNLQNLQNGEYKIQPMNSRKISFSVGDSSYKNYSDNNIYGWNFKSLRPSNIDWNISGLRLNKDNSKITIRNFIDLHRGKIKGIDSDNQIIKTLSRQKTQKW